MYKGTANTVLITGNLGQEPELKYAGNTPVINGSVATSRKYKDSDKTDWHNFKIWGTAAENFANLMTKGAKIQIIGELQYDHWDKDGEKRVTSFVNVREWQGLSGFRDTERRDNPARQQGIQSVRDVLNGAAPTPPADDYADVMSKPDEEFDQDIPFR